MDLVSAKFPRRPELRGRFNCHSSLSTDRDPLTLNAAGSVSNQVLLIDGDHEMSEMLAEYLDPERYSVHLAYTAKARLDLAAEGGLVLFILTLATHQDKCNLAI